MEKSNTDMSYGIKVDYFTSKTYDLDKTYKNIIKPAVTNCKYQCIRDDEISESGIIDKNIRPATIRYLLKKEKYSAWMSPCRIYHTRQSHHIVQS